MTDDDWVLLSEIEHWVYCPRQWAIIHQEQYFTDNDDTTRGHLEHQRVDTVGHESRHGVQVYWAVNVASDVHRLRGRCDRIVVEGERFIPVEHKSGRRSHHAAVIQLVGQAICLEEMLGRPIRHGRLYLAASNTFEDVDVCGAELRAAVNAAAAASSFLPSLSAPYLAISKSRPGNTGALMRARMELASSAATAGRAVAAAAEIRKARRFSICSASPA